MLYYWPDYLILGIIGISASMGIFRGLFREAVSLVAWIAILWVSLANFDRLAVYFKPYISSVGLGQAIAFTLLFIVIFIIVTLGRILLVRLFKKTGFSVGDRVFGLFFGVGRGVLLVAILLLLAGLTKIPQEAWWEESILIPKFKPIIQLLYNVLPENLSHEIGTEHSWV